MYLSKDAKTKIINSLVYADKEYTITINDVKFIGFSDVLRCFEWVLNKEATNGKDLSVEDFG